ncbi:site-specific integrase [Rubrivivax rivuli]|uniref:Site-specific integrase n=1 Tax=Rubrivivax rivuli TaxID=1862385 RepID=A0A437RF07_9BURK|nr:site-specific integrase [Rubrivivax rivuli]RVU45329.1 site-specific integrase [Rubrivivax rivuli]
MGRTGSGVEVRAKSIRFTFVPGKPTLMVNGVPALPTPANVKWALRLAGEIRERMRYGTFSMAEYFPAAGTADTPATAGTVLDTWLSAQRIEGSTKAGYESALKFWKTAIGDKPARAVRHSDILTALAARPDLSGKTINNYVSVARQAFALAVKDKAMQENPAADVPRASWQRDPPDPFTRDEAEAIIADFVSHYPEPVANMIEWRFFSGVRTSEMAGLRWPQVDLARGSFRISETIVRGQDKGKTKTSVVRDVLANSRALAALQRQRKHTQMAGQHVWLDPRYGTEWREERAFRRSYWEPCLKRLGIRYRPPNNCRHTYATMMLMAGMRPAFCAKQLGHSIEMFLRTYSRWISGEQDAREMLQLEAALADSSPGLPQKSEGPAAS